MATRAEITTKCAKSHTMIPKKDKGVVHDEVIAVAESSRDNVR